VEGWRAAEVREREHRREEGPMSPLESFEAAMELYELCPPPSPEVEALRAAEDDKAREVWRKLRKHCAWVPEDASHGCSSRHDGRLEPNQARRAGIRDRDRGT
jgi:hypothetical protein